MKYLPSFLAPLLPFTLVLLQTPLGMSKQSPFYHHKLLHSNPSNSNNNNIIYTELIVVLDEGKMNTTGVNVTIQGLVDTYGGKVTALYEFTLKGAVVSGIPITRLRSFLDDEKIKYAAPNVRLLNTDSIAAAEESIPANPEGRPELFKNEGFLFENFNAYVNDGQSMDTFFTESGARFAPSEFVTQAGSGGLSSVDGVQKCSYECFGTETAISVKIWPQMVNWMKSISSKII